MLTQKEYPSERDVQNWARAKAREILLAGLKALNYPLKYGAVENGIAVKLEEYTYKDGISEVCVVFEPTAKGVMYRKTPKGREYEPYDIESEIEAEERNEAIRKKQAEEKKKEKEKSGK